MEPGVLKEAFVAIAGGRGGVKINGGRWKYLNIPQEDQKVKVNSKLGRLGPADLTVLSDLAAENRLPFPLRDPKLIPTSKLSLTFAEIINSQSTIPTSETEILEDTHLSPHGLKSFLLFRYFYSSART